MEISYANVSACAEGGGVVLGEGGGVGVFLVQTLTTTRGYGTGVHIVRSGVYTVACMSIWGTRICTSKHETVYTYPIYELRGYVL